MGWIEAYGLKIYDKPLGSGERYIVDEIIFFKESDVVEVSKLHAILYDIDEGMNTPIVPYLIKLEDGTKYVCSHFKSLFDK